VIVAATTDAIRVGFRRTSINRMCLETKKVAPTEWARASSASLEFDQQRGRRLLFFDNGRAASATSATNGAFLADFGLLDAVFSFHAALEGHWTDLRHDLRVRRARGGNRAVTAGSLYDVVLISQCWDGASND
jgi:hypothetical protein